MIVFSLLPVLRNASSQAVNIRVERLLSWMDSSQPPLVLDVRGHAAYQAATVVGAVDAGADPLAYRPEHSKVPVVLIAPVDADPEIIHAWYKRLADAGHEVWILEKGFASWIEAGGQIENHKTTYTLPGSVPFIVPKGLCEGGKPVQIFE